VSCATVRATPIADAPTALKWIEDECKRVRAGVASVQTQRTELRLPFDAAEGVPAFDTSEHETYTEEEPNALTSEEAEVRILCGAPSTLKRPDRTLPRRWCKGKRDCTFAAPSKRSGLVPWVGFTDEAHAGPYLGETCR
jgi:hypothetical protein